MKKAVLVIYLLMIGMTILIAGPVSAGFAALSFGYYLWVMVEKEWDNTYFYAMLWGVINIAISLLIGFNVAQVVSIVFTYFATRRVSNRTETVYQ